MIYTEIKELKFKFNIVELLELSVLSNLHNK